MDMSLVEEGWPSLYPAADRDCTSTHSRRQYSVPLFRGLHRLRLRQRTVAYSTDVVLLHLRLVQQYSSIPISTTYHHDDTLKKTLEKDFNNVLRFRFEDLSGFLLLVV